MTSQEFHTPIRGAMVGYGFIGSLGHAPGYEECARRGVNVDILAIADICEARRRKARADFGKASVYDDYRKLLDEHARDLDFVDIAVPPVYHAEIARHALDLGLHVLCEKPLTTCSSDALMLARTAIEKRRVLFPCHNYRHAPSVRAVRQILATGAVGAVEGITQQTFRTTHARGVAEWKPDWRRDSAFGGGGILMDHGSHTLYLAFEWLGGYPETVSARTFMQQGYATEDNATATFSYARGIAHASLSWTAGARKVLYTLQGSEGALLVDDDVVRFLPKDPRSILPPGLAETGGIVTTDSQWGDASHKGWFADMFLQFLRAIEKGAFVGNDAFDAIECVNAIEACYASARAKGVETRIARMAGRVGTTTPRLSATAA